MRLHLLLFILLLVSPSVLGANVLMFLTFISKSLKEIFIPISNELAKRGHTVTLVTSFAEKTLQPGVKEIYLKNVNDLMLELGSGFIPGGEPETLYSLESMGPFREIVEMACESILDRPEMQAILDGKEKFDLVVLSMFSEDCGMGISKKLDVPFVYVSSFGLPVEFSNNLRFPACMSYCPLFTVYEYTNQMTFKERLKNTFYTLFVMWLREWYFAPAVDRLLERRLGPGLPSVLDIERNASLIIINDHFSLSYARPIMPNIIQASCVHCRPAKPLPKELSDWVEGSGKHGFIYFSLGSVIPADNLPKHLMEAFIYVFSRIKQRVVWKVNADTLPNLSSNVKLFKWLPQQDLLGHPKIKLLMCHGGLLSVQEAAYHGVPMLGFPVDVDQPYNMRFVENSGAGMLMNWDDITKETLEASVKKLVSDPKYKQNAATRKAVIRDQQNSPMDTAIYWIEYVLRYDGAPQLRTGGLSLSWYQYYQIDLLVFVFALILLLLLGFLFAFRRIFKFFAMNENPHEKYE